MVLLFVLVIAVPVGASFFALTISLGPNMLAPLMFGLMGAMLVWIATIVTDRWRRPQ